MATTKITITLENHQLEEIRALVAAGTAASVSAFAKHAIGVALFDAAGMEGNAGRCATAIRRPPNEKGARVGRRAPLSPRAEKGLRKREVGVNGITFDAGGLIALDRNDRRVLALLARAAERGGRITIPATALAQALRSPARQARLSRLIRQAGTDVMALTGPDATAVGPSVGTNRDGRHRRCPRRHMCAEGRGRRRDQRRRRSQGDRSGAAVGGRLTYHRWIGRITGPEPRGGHLPSTPTLAPYGHPGSVGHGRIVAHSSITPIRFESQRAPCPWSAQSSETRRNRRSRMSRSLCTNRPGAPTEPPSPNPATGEDLEEKSDVPLLAQGCVPRQAAAD